LPMWHCHCRSYACLSPLLPPTAGRRSPTRGSVRLRYDRAHFIARESDLPPGYPLRPTFTTPARPTRPGRVKRPHQDRSGRFGQDRGQGASGWDRGSKKTALKPLASRAAHGSPRFIWCRGRSNGHNVCFVTGLGPRCARGSYVATQAGRGALADPICDAWRG